MNSDRRIHRWFLHIDKLMSCVTVVPLTDNSHVVFNASMPRYIRISILSFQVGKIGFRFYIKPNTRHILLDIIKKTINRPRPSHFRKPWSSLTVKVYNSMSSFYALILLLNRQRRTNVEMLQFTTATYNVYRFMAYYFRYVLLCKHNTNEIKNVYCMRT